jgi:hypothetical protein
MMGDLTFGTFDFLVADKSNAANADFLQGRTDRGNGVSEARRYVYMSSICNRRRVGFLELQTKELCYSTY